MKFAVIVRVALLAVLVAELFVAGCVDGSPAEMKAWGTTTALNLPVNVTRAIAPGATTFTFTPKGDEAYVTIDSRSYAGPAQYWPHTATWNSPQSPISVSCETRITDGGVFGKSVWYRDPELTIVRQNGTVEKYMLPSRGESPQSWLVR